MNQTTPRNSMTSKQRRDIRSLLNDALDELGFSNPQAQKVLGKGGALKGKAKDILREISTADDLLEFTTTVELPAIERFSVKEKIRVGEIDGVKIGWVSETFQRVFGSLVEADIPAVTLRINRLKRSSVDGQIIAELGGKEQVRAFIAYLFEMMKRQGHGEEGVLLTNGWATVIYVPDPNDTEKFWAVYCFWSSVLGIWSVFAYSVADPNGWSADGQFVSRDSDS